MRVWVEPYYCIKDGLCVKLCPDMFEMSADRTAHIRGGEGDGDGVLGTVVPQALESSVLEAQARCAGDCIYISRVSA